MDSNRYHEQAVYLAKQKAKREQERRNAKEQERVRKLNTTLRRKLFQHSA
ncbi:MAG: hypothetical protein KAS66_05410 [Candidatus Omnitrophica bacterium]|nr:hypothetical protein [Candidatus Omnitrophota bacterium]